MPQAPPAAYHMDGTQTPMGHPRSSAFTPRPDGRAVPEAAASSLAEHGVPARTIKWVSDALFPVAGRGGAAQYRAHGNGSDRSKGSSIFPAIAR